MFTSEENIREADHAANIVEGRGVTEYVGATKVISVRLPLTLAARVQALAHKSGKTRNASVSMLLEVGLQEVIDRLTDETKAELQAIEQELLRDELGQNGEA